MARAKTPTIPPYTGYPFAVLAKKAMLRGGRPWTLGVHQFTTEAAVKALGDDETIAKMLYTLELYPDDFEVSRGEGALRPADEPKE